MRCVTKLQAALVRAMNARKSIGGRADARHYFYRCGFDFLRRVALVCALLRKGLRGEAMNIEYTLSAVIAVGLLIYLLCALLKPEKF